MHRSPYPIVWITGASSGIGAALARRWAAEGAQLILTARRASALEALRASLPDPEAALVLPGDLEEADALPALAEAAMAWRGPIDVMVHNAGVSQRGSVLETTMPTVRRLLEINFFAVVGLTREVVPPMLARGSGQIVVVSSVVGHIATPQRSAYAAAKHAVRAWADALRGELAGTGVGVTVVVPGYVATGISANALAADGRPKGQVESTDAKGMPADEAARRILVAVKAGRREVVFGGPEIAAVWLQRFVPGLVARLLPRFTPR
jgi:dehydrogenase/reductase SDR family protein 7B